MSEKMPSTRALPRRPAFWARRTASALDPRPEPRMTTRIRAGSGFARRPQSDPAAAIRRRSLVVLNPRRKGRKTIFDPAFWSAARSDGSSLASV